MLVDWERGSLLTRRSVDLLNLANSEMSAPGSTVGGAAGRVLALPLRDNWRGGGGGLMGGGGGGGGGGRPCGGRGGGGSGVSWTTGTVVTGVPGGRDGVVCGVDGCCSVASRAAVGVSTNAGAFSVNPAMTVTSPVRAAMKVRNGVSVETWL